MAVELDHIVLGATTLEAGVEHVEQYLGVRCENGGRHPDMATHNALLRLGERTYLEVIAIDPDADAPPGPRWFGLDDPTVRDSLRERPRLLSWVARTSDIDATLARCVHDGGHPRAARRGDLRWRIAFADDGHLVERGLVPTLIEWGTDTTHPAQRLRDHGFKLAVLAGGHPAPERVRRALAPLGLTDTLDVTRSDRVWLQAGIRAGDNTLTLGRDR